MGAGRAPRLRALAAATATVLAACRGGLTPGERAHLPGVLVVAVAGRGGADLLAVRPDGRRWRLSARPEAEWPAAADPCGRGLWAVTTGATPPQARLVWQPLPGGRGTPVGPPAARVGEPAPLPDGSGAVVAASWASFADLYLVRPGGPVRRLTVEPGGAFDPTVAPDGRAVAFASSRPGHLEVYRLPLTGGSPRRLTFLGRDSYAPRWSPRGDLIVFRSDRDGAPRLYLVRPDGTGLRRLSRRPRPLTVAEDAPAWSPDGRRLAYVERTPSGPRVWLVDLARGAERRLTPEDSAEDVPVWSPDGRVLALRAGRSTATDLVLVRPVEVGRTRLGVPGVRGPLVWVPAPRRCPTELDMVRGGP